MVKSGRSSRNCLLPVKLPVACVFFGFEPILFLKALTPALWHVEMKTHTHTRTPERLGTRQAK